ncbi:hypothetical protein Tco_1247356 [Tanacetum coccineum]
MRTNHQNFSNSRRNFAPIAILTKSGLVPISTTRQSSSSVVASVSTVRPIKTAAPKSFVNIAKTRPNAFQKSHSPSRRPFYQKIALKNRNLNNKVNTVKVNSVNTAKGKRVTSAVGEQGINAVKSKACWVWRPKIKVLDHVSKNSESYIYKQFDYLDPTGLEFKDKKFQTHWKIKRGQDTKVPQSGGPPDKDVDEVVHKELGDRMERAATTASSFEAEQDSGGYIPGSDEGRKKSYHIRDVDARTRKKLNELTELCTKLSEKVTSLEQNLKQTKQVYGKALTKLVKHLEDQLKSTIKKRKAKTFKSYTRRRSTDSLKVSTAEDLFSTAEKFLSTDEEIAQKVRDVTVAYQSFKDMVKGFDREDLVALWSLVKERFRSAELTEDMEKALWVELKRLFEPDKDDVLRKLQRYIHCQLQL